MNILYVSQFFEPENNAGAFRAASHAKYWIESGNCVTVLTGWPFYPGDHIFEGYTIELLGEEEIQGVRVLRSKIVLKPNTSLKNRVVNGLSFLWYGIKNFHKSKKKLRTNYDVVLASSGTVFAGLLGYYYAKKLKLPFVIEFRDLTYSQLLATGSSAKSLKYKLMRFLETGLAKRASKVVVLTNGFKRNLIDEGVDPQKISVVPNGADIEDIKRSEKESITLGYFGTLGISQNVPQTIEALKPLHEVSEDFTYKIIGEGAARSEVEALLPKPGYDFVELLHGMPRDELNKHYGELDMSVVTLQNNEAFKDTIPSKIFHSWARGIPVLYFGPKGEASDLITDNDLGFVLCGDSEESEKRVVELFCSPDFDNRIVDMGVRAKEFIKSNYTREHLACEMQKVLESVVEA